MLPIVAEVERLKNLSAKIVGRAKYRLHPEVCLALSEGISDNQGGFHEN